MEALEPGVAVLIRSLRAAENPDRDSVPLDSLRATMDELLERLAGPPDPAVSWEAREVPGAAGPRPARLYHPPGAGEEPLPLVVLVHGGGFVIGSLATHHAIATHLAVAAGARVLSLDYRLAPEHPFPAGGEDVVAACRALPDLAGDLGVDPARWALFGDSAGGSLAAWAGRELADAAHPPRMQVLAYPAVDMTGEAEAFRLHAEDGFLTSDATAWFTRKYLPEGADREDPRLAHVRAPDLGRSPPTVLVLAEYDPLVDDGRAYAAALRAAGVELEVREHPDQTHGFLGMQTLTARANEELGVIGERLRGALG